MTDQTLTNEEADALMRTFYVSIDGEAHVSDQTQ